MGATFIQTTTVPKPEMLSSLGQLHFQSHLLSLEITPKMIKITLSQQQKIIFQKVSLSQGLIQTGLAQSFLGCPPWNSSSTPEALPPAVAAPPTILTQTLRISCVSVCTHCSFRFTPSQTLKSPASFKALLQGHPAPLVPSVLSLQMGKATEDSRDGC